MGMVARRWLFSSIAKPLLIGGCQMTRVEMIYQNNIIIGFRMEGHAGFNTKGPDVVCASLSATSQMTVNGILDWTGLSLEDVML